MKTYLEPIVAAALRSVYPAFTGAVPFEQPKLAEHGDIATPVAMSLAKILRQPPRTIAERIARQMTLDPAFCSCEIAVAGYINFRFTPEYFIRQLDEFLHAGTEAGKKPRADKTVNIEFVSANPTGLLHLGHARQAALGDTVANLFDWNGWGVTREYYFNNAGRQMRQLAESIYVRYRQALGDDYPMPEDSYQGEYIKEIAEEIRTEKGDSLRGTEDRTFFRKYGEQWCFDKITASLDRMGVKHDVFFNEDTLYTEGKIEEVIAELRAKGLAYDKEGAVWFKLSEFGLEDRVIVKSTGEPTYRLPDIAYHREKLRRGYDLVLDIFGSDHQVTIPDVLAGVRALGCDDGRVKVLIHGWVNLIENGVMVKMSKRTGKSYTLDDLLDEFGSDVVRFFLIMRSASAPLDFDLALARDQSEKNPVFYLQYAHARIASILRFAKQQGIAADTSDSGNLALLQTPEEQRLIKTLLVFPEEIESAASSFEPHRLCEYLKNVAGDYHKFYHDHRVVGVEEPLMRARLALCVATLRVLKSGLAILGIGAPERMTREERNSVNVGE